MKALQPSNQKLGGFPRISREPPNESFAVEERELRERVNPVPLYQLHDDFRGFCHHITKQEETKGITPKAPRQQTLPPCLPEINSCLQSINLSLHCHFQLFPTRKRFHCSSPEGPAVPKHSRKEQRMKERKEDKIFLHDSVY